MSKECSPPNSKETSPQPSAAVKKAKPNLMSKSTGDISQLTKEPKLKMSGGGVTKSSTRISKLKAQQDLLKLTDKVDTLVKLREQHHKMTQHLLVDKLKEESDMMKDVDRQIRMLKRCAEKRLEVLKSPTISGICYVRCLDCKDCVAMSRGTQTWSMFEDYDPPLPPHAPVVAVTTPGAKAIENMDKRMKRLGSKLDLVNDKTTDMVKRTTCLHHNCGEFKRKLNELEDDLRYLTIILD